MSIDRKIDQLIEEGLLDLISRNPGKSTATAAGVGGLLGYGLHSGAVQNISDKLMHNSPEKNINSVTDSVKDTWDSVKDTKINEIPEKVGGAISHAISSVTGEN